MQVKVPVVNQEDGSVQFEASLSERELQVILQFGLNMALASGIARFVKKDDSQMELDFGDSETLQ